MAKCFDVVGYIEPCNAVRQKYTGRAILITGFAGGEVLIGQNSFSDNGIKVTSLYGKNLFSEFVTEWKQGGGKALPVTIDAENPFGVTIQGNTDSGRVMYTKTIPVSIPATRDGKAEGFIMGLQKGLYCVAFIVLETFGNNDAIGINENDMFGVYSPVRIDPTSVTRSEYENGGSWNFNLVCEEPLPNVICTMTEFSSALDGINV